MIDAVTFKQLLADVNDPGNHAALLKVLLEEIRRSWIVPEEAWDEVSYVCKQVFPNATRLSD